jgi:putative transposase
MSAYKKAILPHVGTGFLRTRPVFRRFQGGKSNACLPAAVPYILTGMRIGIGTAFIVVIVSEMIAVYNGLGFRILEAREYFIVFQERDSSHRNSGLKCLNREQVRTVSARRVLNCQVRPRSKFHPSRHRDAHAQPFAYLATAWRRYFAARREQKPAHPPVFKKKGRCRDSFYVANDKLRREGMAVVLPKVGCVMLRETLRWPGKIMGASVSREADHWFLALQVDVPDQVAHRSRSHDGFTGVDLGISFAATLSSGEKLTAPRPLKAALRRLRIRSRRQSRKLEAAKAGVGISGRIPKGTRLPVSKNRTKGARRLARLHARIARVRMDFMHKLTTRLCRENQTVVVEDLNVRGMLANARLARAIADIGFYEFRHQLQYKTLRYGTTLMLADRWYPSSKLCSGCGERYGSLSLGERAWTCAACGAQHDRDINAAINLQRLATGALAAQSALPVASPAVTAALSPAWCRREAGK